MENKKQPICPSCKSKTIVYRKRENNYICRRCGELFSKEKNGKE